MKKTVSKIREMAESRGIATAYQLQKAANLSSSMAARLYRNEGEGVLFSTLDALCDVLECEPGDLLVRVEEARPTKKASNKDNKSKE